jgi:hypothetical protein
MAGYLKEHGLTPGQEPEQISVGVVVWNINHLKAGDDEDDVDEEVAVGDDEASLTEDDAAAITEAMTGLKGALGQVAKPVGKAIRQVIAELDKEPGQHSDTRSEVSQLDQDISQLLRLDLEAVLMPAIKAMTERAQDAGKSAIEVRASQLERIRGLARVWKRLKRLQTVLISGEARLEDKVTARESIRGKLDDEQAGRIGDAITELLDLLPVDALEAVVNALKRGMVVDLATETFLRNPAVNLVLLNEMNLGITQLESAVERRGDRLGLSKGPEMLAKGQAVGDQLVGRQYEYYPAVHRTGGERGLTPVGTFYASTAGHFAVQEGQQNKEIGWDKSEKTFRGIVVHRYKQGKQEFWAGVLHTTPAGKDLNRTGIWPQIRAPLGQLSKLALFLKIPLLVGGDFASQRRGS